MTRLISSTEAQGGNPAFRLYENEAVNPEIYIDPSEQPSLVATSAVVKLNCFTRGFIGILR